MVAGVGGLFIYFEYVARVKSGPEWGRYDDMRELPSRISEWHKRKRFYLVACGVGGLHR